MKPNIYIVIFLLIIFCNSYAQPTDEANRYRRYDSSLALLRLDTLHGKAKTIYSKNYSVRAKTIQSLIEKCTAFYEKKFPEIKFTVQVLLLDTVDFNKVIFPFRDKLPYAFPFALSKRNLIVLWADKKAMGDNSPDSVLSDWDGTALHELGHIFWNVEKHINLKENWANEFLANYFAGYYYLEFHPNEVATIGQENKSNDYQPTYKTLEDFERLYVNMGVKNYGWYQGKFEQLSDRLYLKFKIDLFKKTTDNYSAHGKNLEFVTFLKQLAPDITEQWLKEMK